MLVNIARPKATTLTAAPRLGAGMPALPVLGQSRTIRLASSGAIVTSHQAIMRTEPLAKIKKQLTSSNSLTVGSAVFGLQ